MADAQATLADVTEDAQRALAKGFLPVLMRVQKGLSKALADPKTLAAIESFGQGLAGAFDQVVKFAEKIDWSKIGSGLKVAAEWGGKFIGAIAQMPPEVLGAIIALGGLNKLSGGAVSGIVSELGKGLIKGVLGITAGVVNVNGGVVNGGGGTGIPGKGGGTPGVNPVAAAGGLAAPGLATLGAGIGGILAMYALPALVAEMNKNKPPATGITNRGIKANPQQVDQWRGLIPSFDNLAAQAGAIQTGIERVAVKTGKMPDTDRRIDKVSADIRDEGNSQLARLDRLRSQQASNAATFANALSNQRPPQVNVSTNVKVNVSASNVTKAVTTKARYTGTSSRTGNSRTAWQPI
jgi:hypothetical protein